MSRVEEPLILPSGKSRRRPAPLEAMEARSVDAIPRGAYGDFPTMGGFDQMTARLGGFWDSMLGEGRRWWITANSDSHINWTEGGFDFWPGEYSKTYVHAPKNPASIIAAMRAGLRRCASDRIRFHHKCRQWCAASPYDPLSGSRRIECQWRQSCRSPY